MKRGGGSKIAFFADGNLQAAFKGILDQATRHYDNEIDKRLIQLNELILSRTPVWEGDTIHNWRWSTRSPNYDHAEPIAVPVHPGRTNHLPLGAEPRRRANEARPRRSLAAALRAKEPVDIFLTNTSDTAGLVEYGLAPTREAARSRGALRLSIKEVFG